MGEAKRRKLAGTYPAQIPPERILRFTLDHMWRGTNLEMIERRAREGDRRAAYILQALAQVQREAGAGQSLCTACEKKFRNDADIACISVFFFDNRMPDGKPVHPGLPARLVACGIPFCDACATSRAVVARLAREAIGRHLLPLSAIDQEKIITTHDYEQRSKVEEGL
jgi:hypothetical protein